MQESVGMCIARVQRVPLQSENSILINVFLQRYIVVNCANCAEYIVNETYMKIGYGTAMTLPQTLYLFNTS